MMKAALSMPWLGRPERGAELCDRAFRLNAMPVVSRTPIHCVKSYYFMGRYREAIDMVHRTETSNSAEPLSDRLSTRERGRTRRWIGGGDPARSSSADFLR